TAIGLARFFEPMTARKACAISTAELKRFSGATEKARANQASSAFGRSGRTRDAGVYLATLIVIMRSASDPLSKQVRPVSASYESAPSDQRSVRPSRSFLPSICSGLMYAGEPTICPAV